jgi:hypothetical protein
VKGWRSPDHSTIFSNAVQQDFQALIKRARKSASKQAAAQRQMRPSSSVVIRGRLIRSEFYATTLGNVHNIFNGIQSLPRQRFVFKSTLSCVTVAG